jgi:hypothetical protein
MVRRTERRPKRRRDSSPLEGLGNQMINIFKFDPERLLLIVEARLAERDRRLPSIPGSDPRKD